MKTFRAFVALACMAAALVIAAPADAQDGHYWTDQFGNRALLLAGAVVGDPADLSAVYYNPGGLALRETPEAFLAGLSIKFSTVTIADAVADGEDLSSSGTHVTPSLIAGEIRAGGPRHRFAYSFLTRSQYQVQGQATSEVTDRFSIPDLTFASESLQFSASLSEHWFGGTWVYQAADNFGIGATLFVAVRNQNTQVQNFAQALTGDDLATVISEGTGFGFRNWRLVPKFGAAGRFYDWNVGVTVTTPSVSLTGAGNTFNNFTIVGQAVDSAGDPLTEIATNAQTGIDAEFRSPLSFAAGAARTFGPTTVHLSAEWFQAVDLYTVLDSQPFQSQTSDRTVDTLVRQELDSVTNVAIGVEHVFSDSLKGYAGFHTDFSAASPKTVSNLSMALWDLYHVSGGAAFSTLGQEFTLGVNVAIGSELIDRGEDERPPVGLPTSVDVSVRQITVLLGFDFDFSG